MSLRTFATFILEDQLFGIDILLIREINRHLEITPVPNSLGYIRGLLNLRGQIVTILDLNSRLGLEANRLSEHSHNIILKTDTELQGLREYDNSEDLVTATDKVGLLVDSIRDVITVSEETIESPPANIGKIDGRYFSGVIKLEKELVSILSVEKLLVNDN